MIECDKCSDKLRCVTGEKEECDRGFELKMCCRKHLATKKEDIIRILIDTPNEMIVDGQLTYQDVCPMCKQKIFVRLEMNYTDKDNLKKLQEEVEKMRELTKPLPAIPFPESEPMTPYVPWKTITGPQWYQKTDKHPDSGTFFSKTSSVPTEEELKRMYQEEHDVSI